MAFIENCKGTGLEVLPRMRIDFNIIPVTKDRHYGPDLMEQYIVWKVKDLIRKKLGTSISLSIPRQDLHLKPSGYERWTPADYERQLKFGDPGYLIIRDLTFVDRFEGFDWDAKFYNARQFILQGLHYSLFTGDQSAPQLVSTFLRPEEDYRVLTHHASTASQPTIILKGVPSEWLADPQFTLKLRQLFQTLANLRNIDTTQNSILIQYEDSEECCKALKQLCSRSFKKDGDTGMVDYGLTLEESVLVSNESQQMPIDNGYNESAATEALKLRVEMVEKKLETFVDSVLVSNESQQMPIDSSYNESATTEALKLRVEMIEKKLKTVKATMSA